MYWHKRNDRKTGGLWRCAVRKREVQRAYQRQSFGSPETKKTRDLRNYHKPNGGYVRKRRKVLAAQRTQILDQLAQLTKEANVA